MTWFTTQILKLTGLALGASLATMAQPPIPDFTPETPLFRAAIRNDTAEVKRLLDAGANPNEGRFVGFPAVFVPIMNQNAEMFRAMVAKGADVKATDPMGSTTLMWSTMGEGGRAEIAEELMRLGVDPHAANKKGETALSWALKRGHTPVVSALMKAGATEGPRVKESVELALSLLQKSSEQFLRVSGCTSCHHQSLPQMVTGLARERGFAVNEQISKQQVGAVAGMMKMIAEMVETKPESIPDPPITVGYALLGLHAEGYAADETTAAMARLIAAQQLPDGGFRGMAARPPMEASEFTATALGMRAMQLYGTPENEAAVERARQWLLKSKPVTNEDRAMQLMGLAWAKADSKELQKAARALMAEQRPDGGWGQLATLETDAYATGQALVALHEAGAISTSDEVYQRGVGYLLRTQLGDGSWLVRSRAFPFQPYKESGFPHGKDQWISAAGTSWAAMALSLTVEPVKRMESGGE